MLAATVREGIFISYSDKTFVSLGCNLPSGISSLHSINAGGSKRITALYIFTGILQLILCQGRVIYKFYELFLSCITVPIRPSFLISPFHLGNLNISRFELCFIHSQSLQPLEFNTDISEPVSIKSPH